MSLKVRMPNSYIGVYLKYDFVFTVHLEENVRQSIL